MFDNYKHAVFERRITDEQRLTAQMYSEPPGGWGGWRWGPRVGRSGRVVSAN